MKEKESGAFRLENQICFPLYAAAKEVVNKHRPLLDMFNLTYTQYIVMLVLWEKERVNSHELGERVFLDFGTLTPVLKALEQKGLLTKTRSAGDGRTLDVVLTDEGRALRSAMWTVPYASDGFINLEADEAATLYRLLYKILGKNRFYTSK